MNISDWKIASLRLAKALPVAKQGLRAMLVMLTTPREWAQIWRRLRLHFGEVFGEKISVEEMASSAQPDLEEILAESPPRMMRSTHYAIGSLFVILIVIASVVEVDIIVTASGRLIADSPTVTVQPMQLSIVRELRVKPGDLVKKGDILAMLDPTFTQADLASLLAQQSALRAHINRLEAELSEKPLKLDTNSSENLLQQTLYIQRQSQYSGRLRAFDEDIERFQAAILATKENRTSLTQQLDIAREVEGMRAKLFRMQYGSKLNYLDAQVVRMRTDRDYQDASTHLNELQHSLASRRAERQVFIDEWRRQLLEELVKARTEARTMEESLVKAGRMSDLAVLKAPEDGIVLEISKHAVGSVMQQAESLITLVPTNAALIADIMISSADVGYVKEGDEVATKVDAFPYQKHGLLKGTLRSIGEDSVSPSGAGTANSAMGPTIGGVYHRGQVSLTGAELHLLPKGTRLIPGMSLTADIKVGSRSVISYFLYPIRRGFSESIREP
jgi:hemolysin D